VSISASNSYLSAHDYKRATTGQEIASILGNLLRIGPGAVVQGATSLPVTPNTTIALNAYDPVTIFDGSNTEVVQVGSAGASIGSSAIPLMVGAQFGHAAGTSCCSDGTQGSLAEAILEGSAEVERICRQPLLLATYTDLLPLLSMRAAVDNGSRLLLRPRQSPVASVSAITIYFTPTSTLNLNTSQATIDSTGKTIDISALDTVQSGNNNALYFLNYLDNTTPGDVGVTYTAGFAYSALPLYIRRAAVLLVSDILSMRINPIGAAELKQGQVMYTTYLRGDLSGESANIKQARKLLQPVTQEAW